MTNVPVKRGNTARQQPQVATTDADREAHAKRLHEAREILGEEVRPFDMEQALRCERVAQAIARARAEEREACLAACYKEADEWDFYSDHGCRDACRGCAAAIRARGEGGKA